MTEKKQLLVRKYFVADTTENNSPVGAEGGNNMANTTHPTKQQICQSKFVSVCVNALCVQTLFCFSLFRRSVLMLKVAESSKWTSREVLPKSMSVSSRQIHAQLL